MYTAKVLEKVENRPGSWNSTRIGVFRDDEQIGEYLRNYPTLYRTFCSFTINGDDYALYSPSYMTTRIMALPSCTDIGGEPPIPNGNGFCPVEYYVPNDESRGDQPLVGFVAGCIWGDDRSWKIQLLDLAQTAQGILTREERFGYIEMPDEMHLQDVIKMAGDMGWNPNYIQITTQRTFNFYTGKAEE